MGVEIGIRGPLEMLIKQLQGCTDTDEEEKKAQIAEMKKAMQETVDLHKASTAAAVEVYKSNKAECDARAFAIVDTSGDGTLQREEFLEALQFGTEKNALLMEALGIQM